MSRFLISILLIVIFSSDLKCQNLNSFDKENPFSIKGNINFSMNTYSSSKENLRQEPFVYVLSGRPTFSFYGIDIPLSITYSNRNLNYSHPFNQVGIAPSYKWVKVLLGYNSINYSKYVVNGLRIKGIGIELNPGKFRFSVFKGKMRSAIDFNADPQQNGDYPYRTNNSFEQNGYGFKLGIGTAKTFIDFAFIKAEDDDASITIPDSLATSLEPQANTSLGTSIQLRLHKSLTLSGDAGISAFTNDQLADTITWGSSTAMSIVDPVYAVNESSQFLYAGEVNLKYRVSNFSTAIAYKRIDPDYRSLGSYSRLSDMERLSIKSKLSFAKKKIKIGGVLGLSLIHI